MPLAPAPQTVLEDIEANLREASRVEDPVVRKILTAILERQRAYFRYIVVAGHGPYPLKDEPMSPPSDA